MRHLFAILISMLCAISVWGQDISQYYSENEGLDQPVVFTTDLDSPVLYRIQCVGNERFIKADNCRVQSWGSSSNVYGLALTTKFSEASDFYFVRSGNGIIVYTADGHYADTRLADDYYSGPVRLTAGPATKDITPWRIAYEDGKQPGYSLYFKQLEKFNGYEYESSYYWAGNGRSYVSYGWEGDDSAFRFYSSDPRHADLLKASGIDGSNAPRGELTKYVGEISFDGRPLVFDKASTSYFYSLPEALRGGADFTATCSYTAADPSYSLMVNGTKVESGSEVNIPAVSCARPFSVAVCGADGAAIVKARLNFTFLPIVEVNASYVDAEYYNIGTLRVSYDPELDDPDDGDENANSQLLQAAFKYRGATAQGLPKKSYAIKLRDKKSVSYDRRFFGLRCDNNWILDAAGIDPSLMRNRVATDLWNDYSHKPYYKSQVKNERTGTRGRFVEVFLNGEYLGLYCMTEKVDRKQVKAVKQEKLADGTTVQHGSVYKSTQWSYEVFMGHEIDEHAYPRTAPEDYLPYNEQCSETWKSWEIKYPDFETQLIDWGPLYNCVNFTATLSGTKFAEGFDTYWDLDQVKDYYLLLDLLLATDNHGKNMFLINYDQQAEVDAQRMAIGVWDLDGTFGIRWDGSTYYTGAEQDFEKFLWAYEHGTHVLFYRLKSSKHLDWKNVLARRYAKLRHTYFDPESLKQRFADYLDLMAESGADLREEKRWGNTSFKQGRHDDIAGAVRYACDWIDKRIAYLDEQYAYDPNVDPDAEPDGIDAMLADHDSTIAVRPGRGSISVLADEAKTVRVYNAAGQCVLSREISAGVTTLAPLSAGIYVVEGQKVVVR